MCGALSRIWLQYMHLMPRLFVLTAVTGLSSATPALSLLPP